MLVHIPSVGELLVLVAFAGYWIAYLLASRLRSRVLRAQERMPRHRDAMACVIQSIAVSITVLLVVGYLGCSR